MVKIKIFVAIFLSKLVEILSKFLGNKSSAMPGKVARIIYPNILTYLGKQVSKEIIIITGTNGKTTTNNILRDILKQSDFKVACNDIGANMLNGVTSAFVKNTNLFGKLNASFACIEVDEASMPKILDEIVPHKIVITNLFRDQLDRYGEIDLTIKTLNEALIKVKNKDVKLILNADDPLVSQFKFKHEFKTYFYGVDENRQNKSIEDSREGRFCALCGEELKYNYYFYSQLGDYYCENCDFKRPPINYCAKNVDLSEGISFDLQFEDKTENITMNYNGFYNVYNCLGAVSAALTIPVNISVVKQALLDYKPQIGRMERFKLPTPIILNLSKNPAGFNQTIDTILEDKRNKNVLIIINDNAQDGRDISWLWDCDFEKLVNSNINKYIISGLRKEDMAIRLKYAEAPQDKIILEEEIKKAIFKTINEEVEIAYVLVNYTPLFYTQNILKSLEKVYGMDVK